MSDLLTPAELAAIAERCEVIYKRDLLRHCGCKIDHWDWYTDVWLNGTKHGVPADFVTNSWSMEGLVYDKALAAIESKTPALLNDARQKVKNHGTALLRHIAALEARTPAPAANTREAKGSNFGNLSEETTEVIEGLRDWNNDPKLLSQAGESQLAVLELADALDNWKTEAEENADLVVSLEAQLAAAIARAEKAEAERKEDHDILREAFNAYAPFEAKGSTDNPIGRAIVVMKFLNDDLAAARAELGAMGPVEWEASSGNGWGHVTESTRARCQGLPGWEFRAIRVVKEAQ